MAIVWNHCLIPVAPSWGRLVDISNLSGFERAINNPTIRLSTGSVDGRAGAWLPGRSWCFSKQKRASPFSMANNSYDWKRLCSCHVWKTLAVPSRLSGYHSQGPRQVLDKGGSVRLPSAILTHYNIIPKEREFPPKFIGFHDTVTIAFT